MEPRNDECRPEPDEPSFRVLGRDPHAAEIIRMWARLRAIWISCGRRPKSDLAKVAEARQIANECELYWRNRAEILGRQSELVFVDTLNPR